MDRTIFYRKHFKKGFYTLRNERGVVLKKKYNVSLLKLYLPVSYPDETDVRTDEKPANMPNFDHDTNKDEADDPPPNEKPLNVDHDGNTSVEIDVNKLSKLPDEIVQIILVKAVQSSDEPVSTFNQLSQTRFNTLVQRKSR